MNNIEKMANTAEQFHKMQYTSEFLDQRGKELLGFCMYLIEGNEIQEQDIAFLVDTGERAIKHSEVLQNCIKEITS